MEVNCLKTALTIAGSDTIGGAGIQADIKTMTINGVYAMSVITALTAQNTLGVTGIYDIDPDFVGLQIDAVFNDIIPDAVKIGMIPSQAVAEVILQRLKKYNAKNIVVDPVMIATSGARLMKDGVNTIDNLLRISDIITPNIYETEVLSGYPVKCQQDMLKAADIIYTKYGCTVLVKGGHLTDSADDLLFEENKYFWIKGKRIDNPNTHGTGCTLSSAIASNLAKDMPVYDAVVNAKKYITSLIADGMNLGHGRGPLNHAYSLNHKKSPVNW